MGVFTWVDGNVPSSLEVRQVYGLIFTSDGRMLLKLEDGKYAFAGGTPESFDKDMVDTLKRELLEEVGIEILDYNLFDVISTNIKWIYKDELVETKHIAILYLIKDYIK